MTVLLLFDTRQVSFPKRSSRFLHAIRDLRNGFHLVERRSQGVEGHSDAGLETLTRFPSTAPILPRSENLVEEHDHWFPGDVEQRDEHQRPS